MRQSCLTIGCRLATGFCAILLALGVGCTTQIVDSRIVDAAIVLSETEPAWSLWICLDLAEKLDVGPEPKILEVQSRLGSFLDFVGTVRDGSSGDTWWRYEAHLLVPGQDRSIERLLSVLKMSLSPNESERIRIYTQVGNTLGCVMRSREMLLPPPMIRGIEAAWRDDPDGHAHESQSGC